MSQSASSQSPPSDDTALDRIRAAIVVFVFVALVIVFGAFLVPYLPGWARWAIIAALMVGFMVAMGMWGKLKRLAGVLIDSRNKISLARLQITLWTVLVLSAFLAIALPRALPGGLYDLQDLIAVARGQSEQASEAAETLEELKKLNPDKAACFPDLSQPPPAEEEELPEECVAESGLLITFPAELIAALGISAASFAGSTLVKKTKADQLIVTRKEKELEQHLEQTEQKVQNAQAMVNLTQSSVKTHESNVATQAGQMASASASVRTAENEAQQAQQELEAAQGEVDQLNAKLLTAGDQERPALEEQLCSAQEKLQMAQEKHEQALSALGEAQVQLKTAQGLHQGAETMLRAENTNLTTAQDNLAEAEAQRDTVQTELDSERSKREEQTQGLLHVNEKPGDASWSDMFYGDQIGNFQRIDLSKVQMFFFTIVVIFAYTVLVFGLFENEVVLKNLWGFNFPAFSNSLNALLAISHAGYLTVKSVDDKKELERG